MPGLGGVLGQTVASNRGFASGLPGGGQRRRNVYSAHGSGLRTGVPGTTGASAPDTDREAEQARINAQRQASANARNQAKLLPASTFEGPPNPAGGDVVEQEGPPNPYAEMKSDPETEAYRKAVGGGSMGTKLDLAERDSALRELDGVNREVLNNMKRREANPFSQMLGIGEQEHTRLMTQRQFLMEKAQREERLAYQRAMQAQADMPEKEAWKPVPDAVAEGGQRVEANQYGKTRLWNADRQIKNEGPLAAEFNPYSGAEFATVKEPVMDAAYAQAMLPKKDNPVAVFDPAGNPYIEQDGAVTPTQIPGWKNKIDTEREISGIKTPAAIRIKSATPGAAPKGVSDRTPKPLTQGQIENLRRSAISDAKRGVADAAAAAAKGNEFNQWSPERRAAEEKKAVDTAIAEHDARMKLVGAGGQAAPAQGQGGAASAAPPIGTRVKRKDGWYSFTGGDPADWAKNWKKE